MSSDLLQIPVSLESLTAVLREVAIDDDPALKIIAEIVPLDEISSPCVQQLLVDMIATMKAAPGIGLGAVHCTQTIPTIIKRLVLTYSNPLIFVLKSCTTNTGLYARDGVLSSRRPR
jgi:hypothetical protein